MIKAFDYHQPSTLQDAVELWARYGSQAHIIAGGSALLVEMRHDSAHLIGLENIRSLSTLSENGTLHIGAMTTLTDLASFAALR